MALKRLTGRALRYGDNINTDIIIPAKYLNTTDITVLAKHAMEPLDPEFKQKASTYNILVAGKNFGCGSSREHAAIVLKAAGIQAIIARSYARIFFRNAINQGIPALQIKDSSTDIDQGDLLDIDLESWKLRDISKGKTMELSRLPDFLLDVLSSGGLTNYLKKRKSW
jgi:3-isopropylmalate/(R)-2-methylmalate dehydratase small subunit